MYRRSSKYGMRLLTVALTALVYQGAANGYDLLDAYQQALANDPIHQAALARQEAERERLPEARSFLLPDISATMRLSHLKHRLFPRGVQISIHIVTGSY